MSNQKEELAIVRNTLTKMEGEFKAVLPPQIPVEKFVRTMMTAVQMNPDLLQADRKSLFATGMKAAQDGLLLDGREAAAVIFNKKNAAGGWEKHVQYMPMLGGLLKKLRNSGELHTIAAHVVYENDVFDYELGDEERIVHKPILRGSRGEPLGVYAVAKTKDGAVYREVMSIEDVEKVRNVSRSKDRGPWTDWWDEMAKKSVIRRLCKRLPSSADVDALLAADNETYELPAANRGPVVPASIAGLNARIAGAPVETLPAPDEADDLPMGESAPAAVEAEIIPPTAKATRQRRTASPEPAPAAPAAQDGDLIPATKTTSASASEGQQDGDEWSQ